METDTPKKFENENTFGKGLLMLGLGAGVLYAAKKILDRTKDIDLNGKTVLITGGGRGLGLVLARRFAEEGAKIAICAREEKELADAKKELEAKGAEVFAAVCDITDEEDAKRMVEQVRDRFGRIDVLVNNAGVIQVMPLENASKKDYEDALNTHFWGVYYLTNAVLPEMKERGAGRIVNISSIGGKVAVPHLLPYSVSKFALAGYSEGLRAELLKDGIYVTTVCPGLMRTGSPRQTTIKGNHELEYAWFKIGDSLPLLTVSAEYAAEEIVGACRKGEAEIVISFPAQILAAFKGLFPGTTAHIFSLVNLILPKATAGGDRRLKGKEAESILSDNILTTLTDKAAVKNNEMLT
jgi:NAD(P)-dependent dehydrogenase (short-subunit alcohol dehydrogenase family)